MIKRLLQASGCGCSGLLIPVMLLVVLLFAALGSIGGWLSPLFQPGGEAPVSAPAGPPGLGSPTAYLTATPEPTLTPVSTPPLLWAPTPDLGREPALPPPPLPNLTPPPDLTATQAAYAGELGEWQRRATEAAGQYQQTATAVVGQWQATLTALVPTATPLPPTPVGGGPHGWPVDPYCRNRPGCAAGSDGIRVTTQDYGCTWLTLEYWCSWCADPHNAADSRYKANGRSGQVWTRWHRGIDFDLGDDEQILATIDGEVRFASDNRSCKDAAQGCFVVLADVGDHYRTYYLHLERVGNAVDIRSHRDLGRQWQAGDRIRPLDDAGRPIAVGIGGTTGYSTGKHLHYEVHKTSRIGLQDLDPVPFIQRQNVREPLPPDDPPYYAALPALPAAISRPLLGLFAPAAQARPNRLRVVVRSPDGQPVAGLGVAVSRVDDLSRETAPQAVGSTDQRGISDYPTADWPAGEYEVRLKKQRVGQRVASDKEQAGSNLGLVHLGGDEWLLLILYPDGHLVPDVSYSLKARPQPEMQPAAPPAPLSWQQVVMRRSLSQPRPTAVPTVVAAASDRPFTHQPPAAQPQPGDGSVGWLLIASVASVWLLVRWFVHRKKGTI